MKRIIIHWTAGTYQPNNIDFEHYHFLVTGDGLVIKGKYTPEDNINCNDGKYAAHTGGGNTGSIGVAMCGMADYSALKGITSTKYPLKKFQCERCFKLIAELCKKYNIPITPETVMTHYEFGLKHPNSISAGKIDITALPDYLVTSHNIGDFIRNKIKWYYKMIS